MGKAVVLSCDQGRASIQYDRLDYFLVRQIAAFDAALIQIDIRKAAVATQISDTEALLNDYTAAIDAQIADYSACVLAHGPRPPSDQTPKPPPWPCEGMETVITDNQKAVAETSARLYVMKQERHDLDVQQAKIEAARVVYQAELNTDLEMMEVWVADWTEDTENPAPASKTGTIEVWGMRYATDSCRVPRKKIILVPQYDTAERVYQATPDFQITGPMNSEACRVFDMLATWCWVQEHRPRYITARITALSQVTRLASVIRTTPVGLDAIEGVTEWTADGVEFHYRDCGSRAFRVGDRVIVEFAGANKLRPRIIGFEDNPRPCNVNPPIVLWDATANNYIRLEYLEDDGSGNPGWIRSDSGVTPVCGSFQWRRVSDGAMVSVVASTFNNNVGALKGSIWQDETYLDGGPSGWLCTGAALHASGAIVAFCTDSSGGRVSVWVKQAGTWGNLFTRNGITVINYQGALFSQDALTIYAPWTDPTATEVGMWQITITWGGTITASVAALADSALIHDATTDGNWADGGYPNDGHKTENSFVRNVYQKLMMAYSPDTGEVVSVGMVAEERSSGTTTGAWLPGSTPTVYQFNQAGESVTGGAVALTEIGATFSYGGNLSADVAFGAGGYPSHDTQTADCYASASGPMATAIASLGIPNPFPALNSHILSPFHFGGLLTVQAYETDGTASPQGYYCLIGADGSLIAAYAQDATLNAPASVPRLTITNVADSQWSTSDHTVTGRLPYCQEDFHNVAETPSGQYVALSGNASAGVCEISNGDRDTLLPEWAAGHTLKVVGFARGWRGKGIAWPTI